jgi:hypothetical protein
MSTRHLPVPETDDVAYELSSNEGAVPAFGVMTLTVSAIGLPGDWLRNVLDPRSSTARPEQPAAPPSPDPG